MSKKLVECAFMILAGQPPSVARVDGSLVMKQHRGKVSSGSHCSRQWSDHQQGNFQTQLSDH